jgi:hypothetical protein
MLINRERGYKNMRYLLLKAKRMAVTNSEYVASQNEEGRVECHFLRILAQSRFFFPMAQPGKLRVSCYQHSPGAALNCRLACQL